MQGQARPEWKNSAVIKMVGGNVQNLFLEFEATGVEAHLTQNWILIQLGEQHGVQCSKC